MSQATFDGDKAPRNTLAVWALILGIAGLVLSVVVVGGLVGLVAVVVGGFAFTRPRRKWMAIAGGVTGGLSLPVAYMAAGFWLFFFPAYYRYAGVARRGGTISEISNVTTALGVFKTDVGRYPSTVEGLQALVTCPAGLEATWKGPYFERLPADKWGHPLVYRSPGTADPTSYDLLSVGPDGVEGTNDDVGKDTEN
jgi:type II secretion system protein G